MGILNDKTISILDSALKHYGNHNQITVTIEELCELSAILSKYPRYDTHDEAVEDLRPRVLSECADVYTVLWYIQQIFEISDDNIIEEADFKSDRLASWLDAESYQVSTEQRTVNRGKPCPTCKSNGGDPHAMPCLICHTKPGYKGYKPIKE